MLSALISGMGAALILSVLPGPVFFGLIQTSIQKSFKYGALFALGVAISDLFYILITYFGISGFIEEPKVQKIVAIAGGVLLGIFGLYYFFKPVETVVPLNPMQREYKKSNFILKGFILNIFNPSVLFYWITLVSVITVRYENDRLLVLSFFASLIITILGADIFKSYVANKIKVFFTSQALSVLNKALGIILCGVGIKLLYDAYSGGSFI